MGCSEHAVKKFRKEVVPQSHTSHENIDVNTKNNHIQNSFCDDQDDPRSRQSTKCCPGCESFANKTERTPPPDSLALPTLVQLFRFVNWGLNARGKDPRDGQSTDAQGAFL